MEQQLLLLVSALVLLSTEIHHVVCDTYHILTSPRSSQCPGELTGEPCLTLQQFANSPGRSSSVLLMMESGSHSLNSAVSLSNIYNFTMTPQTPNGTVRIICSTQSNIEAKFLLTSISFVQLQGVSIEGCTLSKFGTNGDSVLINNVLFSNLRGGGMEIKYISNSVQLNNVTFINSDITTIETVSTTRIQMRDISFSGGRSISVGPAAEFLIENSSFQGGLTSALLLYRITRGTVVRCWFHGNNRYEEHGGSSSGGAMSVLYSASVLINESIFDTNSARGRGGAIYGHGSNITINQNTFTGNSNSGVYVDNVNLIVINSNFSDSRATGGAAVTILRSHRIEIIACNFTNNVASDIISGTVYGTGGALTTDSCATVSIRNSNFMNNRAGYGGAIYDQSSNEYVITDCSFSSNTASHLEGGAMRMLYVSHLTLLHNRFDSNSAGTKGGAIFVSGSVTANWSNFTNNRADSGGALYVDKDNTEVSVSHGYFKNNTARTGTGGAIFYAGQYTNVSLVDSTFDYNSATSCGVLDINDLHHYSVKVIGSTFSYNTATGRLSGGGVICVKNASMLVADSTFSHNSAMLHAGVFTVDECILRVERSLFIRNSADNGGVMYTNINPSNYTIRLSIFINNTAGGSGGVMFVGRTNSQVSFERSSCGYNSAVNRGGVVAIAGSNLVIEETNVFNNTARLGGAISACSSAVTVSSELAGTEDSTSSVCTLYDGYVNRFNISDFIHQELSTTTSMPVASPTTVSISTTQSEPTTTNVIPNTFTSHETSESFDTVTGSQGSSPITDTEDTLPTTSSKHDQESHTGTNYQNINVAIAIACVSLVLTVCICVLIVIYMTVKIASKLTRSGRLGYSLTNDNEFLMQEENEA